MAQEIARLRAHTNLPHASGARQQQGALSIVFTVRMHTDLQPKPSGLLTQWRLYIYRGMPTLTLPHRCHDTTARLLDCSTTRLLAQTAPRQLVLAHAAASARYTVVVRTQYTS